MQKKLKKVTYLQKEDSLKQIILAMGTFGLPDRIEPKIKNPKLPFAITYALGYIVSRGLFLELKRVSSYNLVYF